MFKKILSATLVVAMMFSLTLCLFACKEKENNENNNNNQGTTPEKVTYTVTVVDTDGTPVKGVEITFAPKGSW